MVRDNCINTIPDMRLSAPVSMSLTWRGWLDDGKRLLVSEATQFVNRIQTYRNRHRWRRDLALLDARLLADIGMTPKQARHEAQKPFWKG